MKYANLQYANLRYANLQYADLQYADLQYADLQYANLRYANLQYADLQYANLRYANLRYANLRYANLRYANLRYAKSIPEIGIAQSRILPEGDIIGWKKCLDGVIVKLLIPAKAKRSHAFGRKCRASYAKVLQVFNGKIGISQHNYTTKYQKGKIVKCDKWEEDFTQECAGGIHFFITRLEAEQY